jgi:hypothetical protein
MRRLEEPIPTAQCPCRKAGEDALQFLHNINSPLIEAE